MSLLMDALKKAEQAKRQGDPGPGTADARASLGELALEPTEARTASEVNASSGMTDSSSMQVAEPAQPRAVSARREPTIESHDEDHRKPGGSSPSDRADSRPQRPQPAGMKGQKHSAAQKDVENVFAAKEGPQPAVRKSFAIIAGLFTVAAGAAIAGYVWWQIQPKSGLSPLSTLAAKAGTRPIAPPAPVAQSQVAPPPVSSPTATSDVARQETGDRQATPVASKAEIASKSGITNGGDTKKIPADEIPAAQKPPMPARNVQREVTPESPIRVTRVPQAVNPSLMRAYEAYGRGDYATARTQYEAVLKNDPQNTDALHGMAAIFQREGNSEAVVYYFQRILVANPKDAVAASGLIGMQGLADPSMAESRLKTIAAEQSDNAAPHFALGNLYGATERWGEAQQSYFRAYNIDSGNPDILFNLAVSLEHLHQNRLAAQYYGQSIEAAKRRPHGFDIASAQNRLRALQP